MNAIYFLTLCLIWGSTWMAIKINLNSFPPFYSAGLRFLLAGVVLIVIMKLKKVWFPKDMIQCYPSVIFGLLNGFSYGLVYWGEQFISSGLTAVLNSSLPFFCIVFAYFIIGESITIQKTAGSVTGFLGVLLLFYDGISGPAGIKVAGEFAIITASAIYALASVNFKKRSVIEPLSAVTIQMFAAALILLIVAVPAEFGRSFNFTWAGFGAFMYLSLIGSALAFYLYNKLILLMEVSKLGYIAMITPLIATLLGVVLLGEKVHWQMLIGMALILAGIAIINWNIGEKSQQGEISA